VIRDFLKISKSKKAKKKQNYAWGLYSGPIGSVITPNLQEMDEFKQ
jgi:hypothetical protein